EAMGRGGRVAGIVGGRAFKRPVVASDPPALPGVIAGSKIAKSLQVQAVPREVSKRQLRMNDSGQVVSARRPDGLPMQASAVNGGAPVQPGGGGQSAIDRDRQLHIQALAERAAQGDRSARREMRQLQQQQAGAQQGMDAGQRQARIQALTERAAQGDRSARREMRQLQQQQADAQQGMDAGQRQARIQALTERAAQGDRSARREMRQLQQQQADPQQQAAQQARAHRHRTQAEQKAQLNTAQ